MVIASMARSWLRDPIEADSRSTKGKSTGGGKSRGTWNGPDFFVSFGDEEAPTGRRRWEDGIRYGFISAGGKPWFSRTLAQLFPGARVFVHIPKRGYVGVGIVKETSQRIADFKVEVGGEVKPVLMAPLTAEGMDRGADDPDRSEYVVRVDWIKTLPVENAVWEKGMFANQNSAAKMRHQFTLERLIEAFDLERDNQD